MLSKKSSFFEWSRALPETEKWAFLTFLHEKYIYIVMILLIPEGLNVGIVHKAHSVHVDHSSQEGEKVSDTEIFLFNFP